MRLTGTQNRHWKGAKRAEFRLAPAMPSMLETADHRSALRQAWPPASRSARRCRLLQDTRLRDDGSRSQRQPTTRG